MIEWVVFTVYLKRGEEVLIKAVIETILAYRMEGFLFASGAL